MQEAATDVLIVTDPGAAQEPTVAIEPRAFAERYLAKVTGQTQALLNVLPQQAVLQAFQLACTNLPSGAALTLAGQTAQELMTHQDRARFDQAVLKAVQLKGEVHPGVRPLEGTEGLISIDLQGPSPAFAANQVVLINRKFEQESDPVTRDFVIGHEISHVRHQDAAFKQGVKTLQEMISQACAPGNLALALVQGILQAMMAQHSRQMELRADQDGQEYAIRQGHTPEAVSQATEKFFAQAPTQANLFDSHPPGPERIQSLRTAHQGSSS
jgi:hypothetical protein